MTATRAQIPYRSQYASPELAAELQSGRLAYEDDPRWREFGADTPAEYRRWARCGCGMACLQMILGARGEEQIAPIAELGRSAISYGAYEAEPAAGFGPLIYAGFVAFADAEFGLRARVAAPLSLEELAAAVSGEEVVIASVSAEIRALPPQPARRGGHLVLVHDHADGRLRLHDPAGDRPASSAGVWLDLADFERFYAGRGIAVELPRA
ncbi:MAG TPA: hypothetical protein VKS25_10315 [Solirubrobacteraceae bacterium]|nr:hypothetical protein [Solirubrobacteraceae bacterium]